MKFTPQLTMKIKAVLSSILLISFGITTVTGILLYYHVNIHDLGGMHTTWGFIMSGAVVLHLFFNFKLFISELKMLFRK